MFLFDAMEHQVLPAPSNVAEGGIDHVRTAFLFPFLSIAWALPPGNQKSDSLFSPERWYFPIISVILFPARRRTS
jgi:hypothetical protein